MRLIDADAKELNRRININFGGVTRFIIKSILKDAPTIEAEPVKHGRWRIVFDDYDCEMMECSCCGAEFYDGDNDTVDLLHNYCPNCGAKMDGGDANE